MATKEQIITELTGGRSPVVPKWSLENSLSQIVHELIKERAGQWGDRGQTGTAYRNYTPEQTQQILSGVRSSLIGRRNMWQKAGVTQADIVRAEASLTGGTEEDYLGLS